MLAYLVRRLRDEPVAWLAAKRVERAEPLPLGLDRPELEQQLRLVPVGPLSLGALHRLLGDRLGETFPRPVLRRIHETSGGNPFYALEIARALHRNGVAGSPGQPLAIPENLQALVQARLSALPSEVVEAIAPAALLAESTVGMLEAAAASPDETLGRLRDARAAGVLELDGERVCLAHPLLAWPWPTASELAGGARSTAGWPRSSRTRDTDEIEHAIALERGVDSFPPFARPSFVHGWTLMPVDEPERARPLLHAELERLAASGHEATRAGTFFPLIELELRVGDWPTAERYAREALALAGQASVEQELGALLSPHALVAAHLGRVDVVREAAERALRRAELGGDTLAAIRARGVLGFLELSLGRMEAAAGWLGPAVEQLVGAGTQELSSYHVAQNQTDALIALGELDRAGELVAWVECRAAAGTRLARRRRGSRSRAARCRAR